ncbi:MAG TPA: M14 family zinc carboxypeptidase, partial [Solirubrobacteraceae bacterium]|nr:M14 family zinc carboxypeptidase [Solirubrobacteraceae bacterium]
MALGAPAASAADSLKMYRTTVDDEKVAVLGDLGVDLSHTGYDRSKERAQTIFVDLIDSQARAAREQGLALEEEVPGPHVSEGQIANRIAASEPGRRQAAAKPETGGDSPNEFYDVFRTYSEPGGIKDEMTTLAAAYRGMAKLVVIGKSGQGQDIVALKVTKNARNVADGARPAMLFSAVNHAREWIAAEVGRRMPTWWLEHADDPQIAELLSRNELWFLPIQNPDGYDYTFTCGIGFRSGDNEPCGATLVTDPNDPLRGTYVYKTADGTTVAPNAAQPDVSKRKPTQRLWRKTLRNNLVPETVGDSQDGVDPNRNYPTAWGLDEEGASNTPSSGTYRGPHPLSETEDLAYDRLLRKITPEAVINYHSAAQLLLYPFGYITDVYADDDPWFKALTGTDGDAAVDPYISQRSSDLYITNGETTDHAYNKYGSMSWTPELDECETAAGGTFCSGGSGFTFPDDEGKVQAVFEKNLDFARNVAATTLDRDRPDRPRNATDDETQYQAKAAPDIEPNRFNVSYGRDQVLEATTRKVLGPVDFEVQATGTGGTRTITLRAAPWNGGERFGDLRGKYYQRVRARIPADFVQPGTAQNPRPLVAGNVVNVRVIAGSQQQRFSYRVVSTRPAGNAKRVLVVAAEDYTGLAPNKTDYDTAPRYLDEHVATLTANGYTVETLDLDQPPAGPNGQPGSKLVNDLGVLSHFDAVLFYTGDDLVPQETGEGVTDSNYRRGGTPNGSGAFSLTGSTHLPNWGVRNAHMLRNYMNEGGKVLLSGRNVWVQQTNFARGAPSQGAPQQDCVGGTGLNSYSNYSWWQDPVYGFSYPPDQAGDDDRPHTAFFRELDMPNDWGQWWLGIGSRCEGVGTTALASTSVVPSSGGLLAGMTPFALDTSAGSGGTLEPTQDATTGASSP